MPVYESISSCVPSPLRGEGSAARSVSDVAELRRGVRRWDIALCGSIVPLTLALPSRWRSWRRYPLP